MSGLCFELKEFALPAQAGIFSNKHPHLGLLNKNPLAEYPVRLRRG